MEWSERMNSAIDYIEENLDDEIDINEAADKACCSSFHFQRMFFAIIGITPAEYARRRRLTLAATELTTSDSKVIDIAMKYGYDSPNAFTRAFRKLHGINPQAARESGAKLTAFPRVSFKITLTGGNDMDYTIIEKPAFEVLGRSRKFTMENNEQFTKIPEFWKEYCVTKEYMKLCELSNNNGCPVTGAPMLGAAFANEDNTLEPFIYAICIEKPEGLKSKDFEVFQIPAASWAVFDCTLDTIQEVGKKIFSEWFPSTGYEHDWKPEIEAYFPENLGTPVERCQLWYPVIKKK